MEKTSHPNLAATTWVIDINWLQITPQNRALFPEDRFKGYTDEHVPIWGGDDLFTDLREKEWAVRGREREPSHRLHAERRA